MAGLCTGLGITTDPTTGLLTLDGARQVAWPYACLPSAANGLRVDPGTGTAWVPPDFETLVVDAEGPDKHVVPSVVGSGLIQELVTEQTVPDCGKARWFCWILGGHAGWRQASGNFWAIERSVTIEIDGVPVGFSGVQQVSVAENNSGGVMSSGSAVDAYQVHDLLDPGQTIKVTATYNLHTYTLTANAVNGLAWRAPKLTSTLWRPHP